MSKTLRDAAQAVVDAAVCYQLHENEQCVIDLRSALAAEQAQPVAWAPYLVDRADGVKGRFAIARRNPKGYQEVWNLRKHCWASASDEVLTREEAEELLRKITIPTTSAPPAPVAQQEPVEFDHGIGADRFKVVRGAYWWHVLIGDSTTKYGKFHTQTGAEEMASLLLREFRNGSFVQYEAAPPPAPVAQSYASEIAKIIRHARSGNMDGVRSYALLLCDKMDAADPESSKYLRRVVEGDDGELVHPAAPVAQQDARACTCHPDDNPPVPCPRRYALSECRAAVAQQGEAVALADALERLHDRREPYRDGRVTGQMIGNESYQITATGSQLSVLLDAADALRAAQQTAVPLTPMSDDMALHIAAQSYNCRDAIRRAEAYHNITLKGNPHAE